MRMSFSPFVNLVLSISSLVNHAAASVTQKDYVILGEIIVRQMGILHNEDVSLQWRHNEHDGVSNHQRF